MKNRSYFGPVFLIALGVVLLVNNLRPEISLLRLFADGWPWILVFWGAFRLLEYGARRALGHTLPPPLGAGSVILAFLLVISGSTAHYFRHNEVRFPVWTQGLSGFWGEEFEFPIQERSLPAGGRALTVRNLGGKIRIAGGDSDTLTVTGNKRIRAFGKGHASELGRRAELKITQNGDNVIEAGSGGGDLGRIEFDLRVETPRTTALRLEAPDTISVEAIEESVAVENARSLEFLRVQGPVSVQSRDCRRLTAMDLGSGVTISGCRNIELQRAQGPVTIESRGLDEVRLSEIAQAVNIEARLGRIALARLPGQLEFGKRSISIAGAEGPARLTAARGGAIRLERVSGEVEISGQRGNLEILLGDTGFSVLKVTLDRGNIDLRLPEGAQFTLRAETARGAASHQLGEALETRSERQSATISGGIGQGPEIRLRTGRGDIFVGSANSRTRKSVQL